MSEDRRAIVGGGGIGDGCRKPVSADVACIASREAACITGAPPAINGGIHMH